MADFPDPEGPATTTRFLVLIMFSTSLHAFVEIKKESSCFHMSKIAFVNGVSDKRKKNVYIHPTWYIKQLNINFIFNICSFKRIFNDQLIYMYDLVFIILVIFIICEIRSWNLYERRLLEFIKVITVYDARNYHEK